MCQSKAAVRAGKLLLRRTEKLIIRRLDGKQIAEQLVDRDMTLNRDVLLDGALLTDVHLRAHSISDLRQVNRRIVLVTNLTLHNLFCLLNICLFMNAVENIRLEWIKRHHLLL
jgi:hypothetical protein